MAGARGVAEGEGRHRIVDQRRLLGLGHGPCGAGSAPEGAVRRELPGRALSLAHHLADGR